MFCNIIRILCALCISSNSLTDALVPFSFRPFRIQNMRMCKESTGETFMNCKNNNKIEKREHNIKINTDSLSFPEKEVLNKISGFYGLIGPDINIHYLKTLYELFTGDGMIQGVFFNEGNITFVKHIVRTEKIVFEEKHYLFSKNIFWTPLYLALNALGIVPNVLGLANTAAIKIGNKVYTLFERDLPYLMRINFEDQTVKTVKKTRIHGVRHFSAHSKYDSVSNIVHSIDYNVLSRTLTYFKMFSDFRHICRVDISTKKMPIIHDFAVLKQGILFCESPFEIDLSLIMKMKIPLRFSKEKTKIMIYDSIQGITHEYIAPSTFYIFHYGQVIENDDYIYILAPLYEKLDFDSLNIHGKYKMICIDKRSKRVNIFSSDELDEYNLDFPIPYYCHRQEKTYMILRNIENNTINGFVVCSDLTIERTIFLPNNRHICGEPSLIEIEGSPHLVALAYDDYERGYLEIIPVFSSIPNELNSGIIEIELPVNTTIGFHSIFVRP